jgi:Xaa-Pro aminopeptidase
LDEDTVVVLGAYSRMQLTGDAAAPFRQESNFWYYTGIEMPGYRVIMTRDTVWLIAPDVSETHRLFDGAISHEEAIRKSGADFVVGTIEGREVLSRLSRTTKGVHSLGHDPYRKYYSFSENPAPGRLWRELGSIFSERIDLRKTMARQRAIKQPMEVDAIRRAVDCTVGAFKSVGQALRTISYEYEIEALFSYEFRRQNADHAYQPIVAGAKNACTLHYDANSDALAQSSLVLIDVGARVEGYAADMTRTYEIGDGTARQRAVYEAVKRAHEEIITRIRPGVTFVEYQRWTDEIMQECLRSLELLQSPDDYRRYFPHAISHGLGVDVHDSLGDYDVFTAGMVVTVEPGVYIPEEGIGVRLEDDILVTNTGVENLSAGLSLSL